MDSQKAKILIVDDQPANIMLLEDVLDDAGFENIESLTDPRLVEASVKKSRPDIVLLDIRMPFLDGFDILQLLANIFVDDMPLVMVLTAESSPEIRSKSLSMGAIDFLNKPLNNHEVVQRVTNLLEFDRRRQSQVSPNADVKKVLTQSQDALIELAMIDPMSGLPNRRAILKDIVERYSLHRMIACMVINIDGMEQTEHVHGHLVSEKLFRLIADKAAKSVNLQNTSWGCWGGNQLLLITETISELQLKHFADEILKVVQQPHYVHALVLSVNARIGICLGEEVYNQANELVRRAQLAMPLLGETLRKKIYDASLEREMMRQSALRSAIPQAIVDNEFEIFYQPKVNLANNTLKGVEALVRWKSPVFGMVAPDDFISLAEFSGRMEALGNWIIKQALSDIKIMHRVLKNSSLSMAINISPIQLANPKFSENFIALIREYEVEANAVEIEVTESLMINNLDNVINQLNHLRDEGVSIALDDFGTGYSSLSYLKQLPIDVLKIDRAFVVGIVDGIDTQAMIKGIINLAKVFNFTIVAEGIEEHAEANILHKFGCHIGQGYMYSRPLPLVQFFDLFNKNNKPTPIQDISLDWDLYKYLAS